MNATVYEKALKVLENIAKDAFKDSEVQIVLFGSRARGDYAKTSDIDIGILPNGEINRKELILLREKVENSNIPYKVDVVNLSQTSKEFTEKALKEGILWKS
ncbi:MAG: Nucleotidyltransferase domain protein [Candidatus Argoarchaeum ethanivorans]|uniref:Nucleotidyltransferase domain protein n=1 Tax=Candidatus Argoarchaeum ethanivorans TaxID=2608793 RepID=A0A811TE33_9EURY|nr:MAG: Nucleotidyltransferase domain protein [Candidatus Argoarchaeum ethanivorans]